MALCSATSDALSGFLLQTDFLRIFMCPAASQSFQCGLLIDVQSLLHLLMDCKLVKSLAGVKVQHRLWFVLDTGVCRPQLRAVVDDICCVAQWCGTRLAGRSASTWQDSWCCWWWRRSTSGSCGNLEPSPRRPRSPTLTIDTCKRNMGTPSRRSDRRYFPAAAFFFFYFPGESTLDL